ncbi:MAG: hypothetical protein RLZ23_413 [Actinomycetota bacterium]
MHLRLATLEDLPAITAIFNSVIASSNSVYREEQVPLSERLAWFNEKQSHGFPIIVVEESAEILGYGGYGTFRPAQGYHLTVEHTIHIAESHRGKGIGKVILADLLDRATTAGFHTMIGAIDSENLASIALHEKFGFTECARIKEVAKKHGKFLDLILMQKLLSDHS